MKNVKATIYGLGCFVQILIVGVYIYLGAWGTNLLLSLVDKDIPFIGDLIIGLIGGSIIIPLSIIVKVLQVFGVI